VRITIVITEAQRNPETAIQKMRLADDLGPPMN